MYIYIYIHNMYFYVTHFNRQFGYFIICSNYKFPCWQLDNHLVPHLALCCYTISFANPHQPLSAKWQGLSLAARWWETLDYSASTPKRPLWSCAGHVVRLWGSHCKTSSRWAGPWYGLPGILFRHIPRYSSRLSGETWQHCFARFIHRVKSGFFEAEKSMAFNMTSTWAQFFKGHRYFTIRIYWIIQNISEPTDFNIF